MSEGGALSGEVYTTYSGIAGARNWRDKEGLKSHFDKSVYFPANPGMIEAPVEGDENVEVVTVTSGINMDNLSSVNRLWISSDEFNVSRAIPSSECVSIGGTCKNIIIRQLMNIITERGRSGHSKCDLHTDLE